MYAQERLKVEEKDAAKGTVIIGNGVISATIKREGELEALMHLLLPQLKFTFELFWVFLFWVFFFLGVSASIL